MKLTPINNNTITEGAEFVYRGATLLVARSGNTNFKKVFRELMKPCQDEFDNGRMSEEQSNEVMVEALAKTILVGWNKFKDVTGEEWEYSIDNAKELLSDDDDVYDAIVAFSNDIENYLTTNIEDLKVK